MLAQTLRNKFWFFWQLIANKLDQRAETVLKLLFYWFVGEMYDALSTCLTLICPNLFKLHYLHNVSAVSSPV